MCQATNVVELMGVRKVEFENPLWKDDDTLRGWAKFGLRVYTIR